jgi:type IV pilus assembly protein PilN
MIRSNLSTRPFYNEAAVRLWLTILAIVVVLATVFNVTRLLQYSRSDTELATQASRDEARTQELRGTAAQLRASVDAQQIAAASLEARTANDLIDRRTFSWTELFNRLEAAIPPEVRITSVRPRIEEDGPITLVVTVIARSVEEIDQFITSLEDTGVFSNALDRQDHVNDQGQIEGTLEMFYVPGGGQGKPAPSAPDKRPAPQRPAAGRGAP